MHWLQLPERTRLILSHRFFDFSLARWEKNLERGLINPFESPGIVKSRPDISLPKSWQSLLENQEESCAVITYLDGDFPAAFSAPHVSRPPIIYLRGNKRIPSAASLIAVVGTRNPSYVGRKNAELFATSFANRGFGIVSGLARGIDAIAHRRGISPYTLAVLGGGVNCIYPKENARLAEDILASGGTLVSPFPDTQPIRPTNFPRRNEWIAAFSAGTIVIEGAETSGANVTGRLTLDIGRHTVALIQDFRSCSGRGAMQLLDWGANYARDPEDALRIIARPWPFGLQPLAEGKLSVPPPAEFTLDEWVDQFGDTPRALRELEARLHDGTIEPLGDGIYKRNA